MPFEWDRQKQKAEFVSKEVDKKRLERRIKNKLKRPTATPFWSGP